MGESYSHLTLEERCRLRGMIEMGLSRAEMARRLGRHRSTIHRELDRNSNVTGYRSDGAHRLSWARKLRFTILTAARSGEVRGAVWPEIDLDAATWAIPPERMKTKAGHRVPLPAPALEILRAVRDLPGELVFPSKRPGRALSDMTLSAVLKRLGVAATVHGFRSTFRDWAEERAFFTHEVKEAALAHAVKNKAEAAYRRGDLFEQRVDLMTAWSRFCCPVTADVFEIGGWR